MTYGFTPDEIALIRSVGLEPQADSYTDELAEEDHRHLLKGMKAGLCITTAAVIVFGAAVWAVVS